MAVVGLIGLTTFSASTAMAIDPNKSLCEGSGGTWSGSSCSNDAAEGRTVEGTFETVVNILLLLVGAVSVIMIVVGGIKLVTSGGNQQSITSAKNTIMYAVVGIIVAFLAYAVIKFVLGSFDAPAGGGGAASPYQPQ